MTEYYTLDKAQNPEPGGLAVKAFCIRAVIFLAVRLFPFNGINRTDIVAGTTICAYTLIDDELLFPFADSKYRADRLTSAAENAFVNDVMCTHFQILLFDKFKTTVAHIRKYIISSHLQFFM